MVSKATNQPSSTVELGYVPSGTHWSTGSDTCQVVEIQIETFTKMYTPFSIGLNWQYGPYAHFGFSTLLSDPEPNG